MSKPRFGVILENLGTPESPAVKHVKPYLQEFLSDRRIVDLPPLLWAPILKLALLPRYAPKSAERYQLVWTEQGSPLMFHTLAQAEGLQQRLGDAAQVEVAMRYGQPTLAAALGRLRAAGVTEVLLVPTYPQYSTTSVASVLDDLAAAKAAGHTAGLTVRTLNGWHDDAGYVNACVNQITNHWQANGRPDFAAGDRLLLSFHGIPVSLVAKGDPYPAECERTAALIRSQLGLTEAECPMAYQSRFGPARWLTPATIDTVRELGKSGRRLDVFCPGFMVDCLETLEEIGLLNRQAFTDAGGGEFHRIDSLNDSPVWLDALTNIISTRLADFD